MPFIDCFTENGYYVFAYDAQGNDGSEGKSISGLPQGIIDLDNAISYAKSLEEYNSILPSETLIYVTAVKGP